MTVKLSSTSSLTLLAPIASSTGASLTSFTVMVTISLSLSGPLPSSVAVKVTS